MERRVALSVLLVAVFLAMVVPIGEADGAVSGDDISVTLTSEYTTGAVTETEIEVNTEVSVKNGQSMTIYAFIDNESDSYLSVTPIKEISSHGVKVTTVVDNQIIGPVGDTKYGHISTAKITVSIDNYIDTKHEDMTSVITVRDTSE